MSLTPDKEADGSWNRPRAPGLVVGLGLAVKDCDTTQRLFGPEAALKTCSVQFSQSPATQVQFKSIVTSYQPCISLLLSGLEVEKT